MTTTPNPHAEALDLLARLDASGDRVMVTAVKADGSTFALFDSPASAADAIIAVNAVAGTCESLGQPIQRFAVRRDETALGLTR